MRLLPAVLCLLFVIAGSASGQDKKNVVVVQAKPDYYVPAENIPYYLEHLKTEARRNGGTPELKAEIERWEHLAALAAMTQEGIRMFLSGTDIPPFTFYTDAEKDLPKFLEPGKRTSARNAALAVIYEVWNTPIWINAISSRTQNAYEEYRSGRTPSSKKAIPYQIWFLAGFVNGLSQLEWQKRKGVPPRTEAERIESETLALQEENGFLLRLQESGRLPMQDYLALKALNKKRIERLLKQSGATQEPAAP